MTKIRKNITYQTAYQIVAAFTPLITAPYISRILGVENIGIYSYTNAVASYYMLFARLGINNYGSRAVAENLLLSKKNLKRVFSSIFFIQLVFTIIMITLYFFYVIFFVKESKLIAWCQMFNLISCLFDINWYFIGIEKISIMAVRGIIIKIATVLSILFLVRSQNDLHLYVLIMSLSVLINNLILWKYILAESILGKPALKEVIKHLKPCIILFLPELASSIYRIMDKIMVGNLSDYEQLGFYYNADKVINIPICLMSGVSMILLPRMTSYLQNNEVDKANIFFRQSVDYFFLVACAMGAGIASVSKEFVPWFFGDNYKECIFLVIIFSPVFIFKTMSLCIRNVYLIPGKKELIYNVAILGGVLTNLLFNALLIPKHGAKGAVFATLITEFTVFSIHMGGISKEMKKQIKIQNIMLYLVNTVIMSISVQWVGGFECNDVGKLILKVLIGVFVYITLFYAEKIIFNNVKLLK